jgi:hypothetical protein
MKKLLLAVTVASALGMFANTSSAQDDRQNQSHESTQKRTYYDASHKDRHEWNDNENSAWNRYRDEHHVKQTEFAKTSRRQQQDYWNWRHEHPDNH